LEDQPVSAAKHTHDDWVRYNPATATYDTPDGTSVAAEIVENACCLADVLRIARLREEQRAAIANGYRRTEVNDLWPTKDPERSIGAALRAGKPPQRNPRAVTVHRVSGWRPAVSRFLRNCAEFVAVWKQYRRFHGNRYAARIAYEIAFRGCPF
jgi:hypothetical protein